MLLAFVSPFQGEAMQLHGIIASQGVALNFDIDPLWGSDICLTLIYPI